MPFETDGSLAPEHLEFYERFVSFWSAPSGQRIPELIAPDATIQFTGAGTFSGADYVDVMDQMLATMNDMKVKPLDCAGNGDRLYIAWEATALFNGKRRSWMGIDRFLIKNGKAIEEQVVFDSAALQETES